MNRVRNWSLFGESFAHIVTNDHAISLTPSLSRWERENYIPLV